MARTLFTGYPELAPNPSPPADYQNIPSNPGEFGGIVGQAEEKAGTQLHQLGTELFQVYDQTASTDAYTKYQNAVNSLMYGDPNDPTKKGYLALSGEAAMNALPKVRQQMEDLIGQVKGNLQTSTSQIEFERDSRRLQSYVLSQAGRHYDQQAKVWGISTQDSALAENERQAANTYNDDQMFQHLREDMRGAAVKKAQLNGTDPTGAIAEADSRLVQARLNGALAQHDLGTAKQIFQNYGSLLDDKVRPAYQNHIRAGADATLGDDIYNSAIGQPGRSEAGGRAVSSQAVNQNIPPEGRALLDTIAGPESKGAYNVRYTPQGGTTFAGYADHPRISEPGPEGPSTAAGRYQIVATTFDKVAPKVGVKDFSPESQDSVAWQVAQDAYKEQTGGDLLAALKAGKTEQVQQALRSSRQWDTANLGTYQANLAKYQETGGASAPSADQVPPGGPTPQQIGSGAVPIPAAQPAMPPGVAQMPTMVDLANREIGATQRYNRALENIEHDPRAAQNPEAMQKAFQRADRDFNRDKATINAYRQAALEARSASVDQLTQQILKGPVSQELLDRIDADPHLDGPTRESLTKLAANPPGQILAQSRAWQNALDLFNQINLPAGNDKKITDMGPILEEASKGNLLAPQIDWLQKKLTDQRTPEGERQTKAKSDLIKAVEPQIDKSNPLMNKIDESGKLNLGIFAWDLDQKIAAAKGDQAKIGELLNPHTYMDHPERLSPYQKTLQQSLADKTRALTGAPPPAAKPVAEAPIPPAGAPPAGARAPIAPPPAGAIVPRNPGESPQDYLKRVNPAVLTPQAQPQAPVR